MGRLVKLLGSGIGLVKEATASHKPCDTSPAANASTVPAEASESYAPREGNGFVEPAKSYASHDETDVESDQEDWILDDVQHQAAEPDPPSDEVKHEKGVEELVQSFMAKHPPPSYTAATGRLPCPVILPQRRPENRARGFVLAYAPVLRDCGIDQATFLDFLDAFDKSTKTSPVFTVINVGALAAGFVPSVAARVTSATVKIAVKTIETMQTRRQSNNFLNKMNHTLFKPHGLYCLLMQFKPDQKSSAESVDVTKTIEETEGPSQSGMKGQLYNMRASSGKTWGDLQLPEAAPLIFPALESMPDEQKQNAFKKSERFVTEYYDKRAQATYAKNHPNTALTMGPEAKFASRYSDPNHPANSSSILALVTGGAIDRKQLRENRRKSREERRGEPTRLDQRKEEKQAVKAGQSSGRGIRGFVRRNVKEGVLYLMIVNMPTEEEMDAASAEVDKQQSALLEERRPRLEQTG